MLLCLCIGCCVFVMFLFVFFLFCDGGVFSSCLVGLGVLVDI